MTMTLRAKLILLFVALHVTIAIAAGIVLIERPLLLFAVEALFVVSIAISIRLVRTFFVPLDLIRTGAELISERDFSMRFVKVGQPEMDTLVDVYNRMIEKLRDERLSGEERHQLLQKIVEASPSGIVICDFDGKPETLNPAASRIVDDDFVRQLATIEPGESRLLMSGMRRLKASRAEFRDRGFPKSFYVIEEMTDELRQTEKAAYEKLIRMMSHEVNNSVGAVRSLLESALRYAPQVGEADRDDYVQALTVSSARVDALNRFMSGFADVVRIPPPRRSRSVVADSVERVVALLRPELEERRIIVRSAIEDRRAFDVDIAQIEQVVLNVFRNAIEATGRDGTIDVSLRDGVLEVADSGPGIASGIRGELFTPFFTTKRDGRGLGLTIVQEIVSNHGLRFSLANGEQGAVFRLSFE